MSKPEEKEIEIETYEEYVNWIVEEKSLTSLAAKLLNGKDSIEEVHPDSDTDIQDITFWANDDY